MTASDNSRRSDPRAAVRRDANRVQRREQEEQQSGHRHFWQSLSVIGMVGWPIAIGAVGGTGLGRYLDTRFDSGIRFTLTLMMIGVSLGCLAAWKTVVIKHD